MQTDIDTDVGNYTPAELLTILGLPEYNEDAVIYATDSYILTYSARGDEQMVKFFTDIQESLTTNQNTKQTEAWWKNEYLQQPINTVQNEKITDRVDKTVVYDNEHMPMKQEMLGVNNTFSVPVAQDSLNPNLKNTTSRLIVLDSLYRQPASSKESATDYTLDLSENIANVLSLRLYSVQIPYTWYAIDYGSNCMWLVLEPNIVVPIVVQPGNYTPDTFVQALTRAITDANIVPAVADPVTFNVADGKLTINLWESSFEGNYVSYESVLVFFDPTNVLYCTAGCSRMKSAQNAYNQTLGWIMGFRSISVGVEEGGNTPTSLLNLNGTKYFIIVLDDLNQNHINNGLIGITETSKTLKMPTYFSPDLPYVCIDPTPFPTYQPDQTIDNEPLTVEKLSGSYVNTQQFLPSSPRTLTQSQLYTINEISKNNGRVNNFTPKCPTASDTFAILPIKMGNVQTGDIYVEFGGTLQDNKRTYFGPVTLERLRIKLLDDRGNVVNLNGCDWAMTLICENLYQY